MALELNGTTGVSLVQDGVVTAADLASGAITSAALPTGSVLQVVTNSYATSVQNTTTSFIDTGLSATITPSSTSSKILILVSQSVFIYRGSADDAIVYVRLLRDSTTVNTFQGVFHSRYGVGSSAYQEGGAMTSISDLDSPNTTSAITYKTQHAAQTTANTTHSFAQANGATSVITLMEIAG